MKKGSYITIQDWMITDLHLKGNELLAYALIYGFSQDEQSCFYGSYQYVMEWLGIDRRSAVRVLQKLEEKGLIRKWQEPVNGVMTNRYVATTEPSADATNDPCQNVMGDKLSPVTECHKDPWQNVTPTHDKMSHKKEIEKSSNNKYPAQARTTPKRFCSPSIGDIKTYFAEKGGTEMQAERFFAYYESNGWRVGKNPMKNWKAAAFGWISRDRDKQPKNSFEEKQWEDL